MHTIHTLSFLSQLLRERSAFHQENHVCFAKGVGEDNALAAGPHPSRASKGAGRRRGSQKECFQCHVEPMRLNCDSALCTYSAKRHLLRRMIVYFFF